MKAFSIDIEAVDCVAYAVGMAHIKAKVTLTDGSDAEGFSELHMSERTLRLIHQGLSKVIKELDEHSAVSITVHPSLPASMPKPT